MAKQQFRPLVTMDQLQYMIHKLNGDTNPIAVKLQTYLKTFALKAGAGLVTTHTTTRQDIAEKLGLGESSTLSPTQKREILFQQWQADPNSVSISDMELVQTYRYENGLMSEHEASEFETSLMA